MRATAMMAFGLFGVLAAGSAAAAPQALLVAVTGDIPLLCEGGECSADVTTMCLQRDREMPEHGTRYTVVPEPDNARALALIGRQGRGQEIRIGNAQPFTITVERGHLAVKFSVSRNLMARFGDNQLVARITGPIVLTPEPIVGDARPHTPVDIDQALNVMRPAAENVLKRFERNLGVARLLNDAANGIRREGRTTPAEHSAAWQNAISEREAEGGPIPDDILKRAREAYQACLPMENGPGRIVNTGPTWAHFTFRDCLGSMHNGMIGDANGAYWDEYFFGI
ncbi:MAG: hypothetical protein EXQ90_01525 [Rhodospirillales bacterium]|nr:hypothetical protein [Rhodospirillales bacterium]